jgi:hypothetical protein
LQQVIEFRPISIEDLRVRSERVGASRAHAHVDPTAQTTFLVHLARKATGAGNATHHHLQIRIGVHVSP